MLVTQSVFIDGKPTQLSGADLQSYLSAMSDWQVEVIELIENPGDRYDASGNAGIVNIKTKANKQRGFNGSLKLSYGGIAQTGHPRYDLFSELFGLLYI